MLTNKEIVLATRVTSEIQKAVENVAAVLGLKPSEYLRRLILDDLEKRSVTTTQMEQMKKELNNHE
jgi:ABC-type sulfate transport system permease component